MADVLPEHVMLDVLSRLPVKTILRCKCVCKKWRDLVSDPYFVRLHLSRSPDALLIHQPAISDISNRKSETLEWVEIEHEVNHVKSLNLNHYISDPYFAYPIRQVGSVNGLICCFRHYDQFSIFNPVLGQYMIIPKPRVKLVSLSYGFGVSIAGEYKVILCGRKPYKLYTDEIQVYTLGTNQWRITRQTPDHLNFVHGGPGVFANGHLYWLRDGSIYDFDLNTERFELLPSPPGPGGNAQMLGVLKGRLSRISWFSLGLLEVWVMKEGSWYKEIVIKQSINPVLQSEPLCLTNGSKGYSILVVRDNETKKLVAYCLDTDPIRRLNLKGYLGKIMAYRPSFVTLADFRTERVHLAYSAHR